MVMHQSLQLLAELAQTAQGHCLTLARSKSTAQFFDQSIPTGQASIFLTAVQHVADFT